MGHIHTKAGQFDFTASAFIIRTDFKEPKVMLHKHKKLGIFLQFSGHVELHETPWQAIIHEIKEEAGYDIHQLKLLQPKGNLRSLSGSIIHPTPAIVDSHKFSEDSDHYHTDSIYLFVTDQNPKFKPEDGESSMIEILTLQEVKALKDLTVKDIPEITEYVLNVLLKTWERVDVDVFSA
jgi:8-oxo-dGTP pyrophosphatase MutT (NUDIX family)